MHRYGRWLRATTLLAVGMLLFGLGSPALAGKRSEAKIKMESPIYETGEDVKLIGMRFTPHAHVHYEVTGMGGSCKDGVEVADDRTRANKHGNFEEVIYTVQSDDCGWYEVTAEDDEREAPPTKFRVLVPEPEPS